MARNEATKEYRNPWKETDLDELRERGVGARRGDDDIEAFVMSTNKVVIILGRYSLVDRVELLAGGVGLNGYEVVFDAVFETVFVTV